MDKKITKVSELKSSREDRRSEFYQNIDNASMTLREAVLAYRYMLDKNQKEFAKFVKVPLRTIQDFEQGRSNPTEQTLLKMLRGSGLELSVRRKV